MQRKSVRVMASRRPSRLIFTAAACLLAIFAIAAAVFAGAEYAIPIVILGVLVLSFLALNALLAKRTMQRHGGDEGAAQDDGADAVPAAHLIADDRPLGDTAQAHDEISPHDLPKDSPARRAAEAQAARRGGITRGHEKGAAGGTVLAPVEEEER
ncbi:MAG: hypothetical protein AVDCRST_MAG67-4520 [uncultured Solirubrobacteraceae bacterium]|uniref:Uncharacterized protein n=1 Tax=uncultured Solirubrobacteraceae bacterium TaxID=1162706 RepID=A0A6J4TVL1_9ACTN|nr:MAG: hypothetical protein AVDCRST_MAG67-4520 [uncultured Solirubrobacteraceae bacterium]